MFLCKIQRFRSTLVTASHK